MRVPHQMLPLAFFAIAIISSCNNGTEQKKAVKTEPPHATTAEYGAFLNNLDTTIVGNATIAAAQFKKLFSTSDTLRNDSAYCLFQQYYYRLCHGLNEAGAFDTIMDSGIDGISLDSPQQYLPELAASFAALRANGFQLEQVEDFIAIVPDDEFVPRHFYPYVSASMKRYHDKIAQENEEGTEEDGGLIISAMQVADRAIWWDRFTTAYPQFALADNAKEYKQFYLTCLLRGLDATPVLEPDTKVADTTFVRAYQYILDKHPNTNTAKVVGPYYLAIMDNKRMELDTILMRYRTQDIILW